ncbi:MAG: hypothetical protein R2834_04290 [Rhodothermales bacterium]
MKSTIRQDDRSETGVMAGGDRWVAGLEEAIDAALRALRRNPSGSPAIHQVRVAVPYMDPLDWLRAQPETQRLFWCGRDESDARAAVGIALDVRLGEGDPYQVIRRTLTPLLRDADPGVRFFGGMRFDLDRDAAAEWEGFGAGRFVLPRFVLEPAEAGSTLVCNLVVPADLDQPAAIAASRPRRTKTGEPVCLAGAHRAAGCAGARCRRPPPSTARSAFLRQARSKSGARPAFAVHLRRTPGRHACSSASRPPHAALLPFPVPVRCGRPVSGGVARAAVSARADGSGEAVAGTRPRGASRERDAELKQELLP